MKISESIINSLFIEVDSLTYRQRNIKHCLQTTSNNRFRERLISENKTIYERVNEINNISNFLSKRSNEKINLSALLVERTRRSLNEIKSDINLFIL